MGNALTAQSGATLPDLMARMGHASPRAVLTNLDTNSTRDRPVPAALGVQRDRARDGHADGTTGEGPGSRRGLGGADLGP